MEVDSQLHTLVRFVRGEKVTGIKRIRDWRKARASAVRRGAQTAGAMLAWCLNLLQFRIMFVDLHR